MDVTTALVIAFGVLAFMLVANVPVSLALALSGTVGTILIADAGIIANVLGSAPFETVTNYSLLVVPMFVLMGMFALRAGLAADLLAITSRVLHWLPGGLGVAVVASCAGFAAVTGSSIATVATLGRMSIDEMSKFGYNRAFGGAILASGATLGVLIPPSIILVIYGILTGESIGALLIAGIIPGILSAFAYAGAVLGRVRADPSLIQLPARGDGEPQAVHTTMSLRSGIVAVTKLFVLFAIVVGGVYLGFATVTESAALAAFVGLFFVLFRHGRRFRPRIAFADIAHALRETVALSGMIFIILVGAAIFTYFLVLGGIPSELSTWVVSLELPGVVIVLLLVAALIPLGMFLDSLSITVITVPLIYEPIVNLGFDGVWLGIIVVKLVEIGMITPPVGMNVFVASGTVENLPAERIFRQVWWFIVADLVIIGLLFVFPAIATWLPTLMSGSG
jgi:tripartite ATP-independent transporter DctM subunit